MKGSQRLTVLGVPGVLGGNVTPGIALPSANLVYLYDPYADYVFADAALTTPIADGGAVRGLKERKASNNAVQAGAATLCPTYRAAVTEFNGMPALEFDGGDYLVASLLAPLLGNRNIYTIYMVLRWTGTDKTMVPICEASSSSANSYIIVKPNDSTVGNCRPYHVDSDGGFTTNLQSSSSNNNDNEARLVVLRRTGATTWESWINGWREKAQTIADVGDAVTDLFTIGALNQNGTVSQQFTGQVALLAGYSADNYAAIEPLIDAYFDVTDSYWADPAAQFLCIGDSKTSGINDPTRDRQGGFGWPPILAASLTTAAAEKWRETKKQRIGISGYTVAQMAAAIAAQLATITYTPDAVLINLGTNDLASLPAEETWKANYRTIISAVHTAYPLAEIYLSKPVRLQADPPSTPHADTATMHGYIDDLVAEQVYLHAGADETALEGGDGYATNFADALHPNHAGYTAYAALMVTALGY